MNCNRSACQKEGATFFNLSTLKWYCEECAIKINRANDVKFCVEPLQRYQTLDQSAMPGGPKDSVSLHDLSNGGQAFIYTQSDPVTEFVRESVQLRQLLAEILNKAEVYGLAGETNHPAVKCEVKGLCLGDFYRLRDLLGQPVKPK